MSISLFERKLCLPKATSVHQAWVYSREPKEKRLREIETNRKRKEEREKEKNEEGREGKKEREKGRMRKVVVVNFDQ